MNSPLVLTDPSGLQVGQPPLEQGVFTSGPPGVAFNSWIEAYNYYKAAGMQFLASFLNQNISYGEVAQRNEPETMKNFTSPIFEPNSIVRGSFITMGENHRQINEGMKYVDPVGVVDLNEKTVKHSLGLASDTELFASWGNFSANVASSFVGGGQGTKTLAKELGRFKYAVSYGLGSYNDLIKVTKGSGLQVHHLIEQRFAKTLGVDARHMLSVVLTREEHQIFTDAWRRQIGYGTNVTREQIENAAREVYKSHPEILKALGLN